MSQILDPQRPTLCLYHNDPDGCCAAAVVRRALGKQVALQPMEIGDPMPWERLQEYEQIVMVDYSLPPEEMRRLRDDWELVWVDHHKTSLVLLGEEMAEVPGERSLEAAACVLTWRTFFPDQEVPQAVALVGDRDIWRMQYPETRAFSEGLYRSDFSPDNDALWVPLLNDEQEQVQELIERGEVLYQARMLEIEEVVNRYGFEITFEGHRTLAVNHHGTGDMGEYIREQGYTIGYCFVEVLRDGRLRTDVTLYSDQVDVSQLARKHGGGGHPGAAGFQFTRGDRPFPPGSEG